MIPQLFQLFRSSTILMGSAILLYFCSTEATDDAFPLLLDTMAFNREVRRNPKFIIPSLLAHMYQKSDGDSVMNTILSRPFSKKASKETDLTKKENIGNDLAHRPIIGNHKKDHLSQPKTKCPYIKLRDSLANQDEEIGPGKEIEVKKGFSGFNRNWYGDSPMVWAPPIPYPNSYVMPYHQILNSPRFSSYHESRPPDPMENLYLQNGVVHKPQSGRGVLTEKLKIRDMNRNSMVLEGEPKLPQSNMQEGGAYGSNQLHSDLSNKNVVAQERKFVVTNVTKYVLDFYCPHCGGEISVSRAKNRGVMSRSDDITVNKGKVGSPSKLEYTKNLFFPNRTRSLD